MDRQNALIRTWSATCGVTATICRMTGRPGYRWPDSNAKPSATQMTLFFLDKGFRPRISFDADPSNPPAPRERLQIERAGDITARMQKALEMARRALQDTRETMIKSASEKRKRWPISRGPGFPI